MEQKILLSEIDAIRVSIDALIQKAFLMRKSPESTLAWRSLQMGKAWLGKMKGDVGEVSPYTPSDTAANIPATVDVYTQPVTLSDDHLQNVNVLRKEIQEVIDRMKKIYEGPNSLVITAMVWPYNSFQHSIQSLTESKFWYGYELAEIRKSATAS